MRLAGRLTLKLYLILDNKGLALVVNFLRELGRDSVMGGGVLYHKALITFHTLIDMWLFNSPLADICPFLVRFIRAFHVLLSMGRLPSIFPAICELLQEIRLDGGGLARISMNPLGQLQKLATYSECR